MVADSNSQTEVSDVISRYANVWLMFVLALDDGSVRNSEAAGRSANFGGATTRSRGA